MPTLYFQIGSLPADFQDVVMREFVPYSVALSRVVGDDAITFVPLGSGTVVRRNNRVGILTAHHCLHTSRPEVSIGPNGTDTLALVLRGGRSVILRPEEAFEHELARPRSNDYGPDLTFIEIAPGPRLESVLAYGSVWNLDRRVEEIRPNFAEVGNLIASTGFPEVYCNTKIDGRDIHRLAHHETAINVISEDSVEERDEWDYLSVTCDYSGSPNLPKTFEGFSGGGIWSMQLRKNRETEQISIDRSALVGVTFYQTERLDDKRKLRGHFIRTIYEVAWEGF